MTAMRIGAGLSALVMACLLGLSAPQARADCAGTTAGTATTVTATPAATAQDTSLETASAERVAAWQDEAARAEAQGDREGVEEARMMASMEAFFAAH